MIAVATKLVTDANLGVISCFVHQVRYSSLVNCPPLSWTRYLGLAAVDVTVCSRNEQTAVALGWSEKTESRMTRREWTSMTSATHQQNGQRCKSALGIQGIQKPPAVGTKVKSISQI